MLRHTRQDAVKCELVCSARTRCMSFVVVPQWYALRITSKIPSNITTRKSWVNVSKKECEFTANNIFDILPAIPQHFNVWKWQLFKWPHSQRRLKDYSFSLNRYFSHLCHKTFSPVFSECKYLLDKLIIINYFACIKCRNSKSLFFVYSGMFIRLYDHDHLLKSR